MDRGATTHSNPVEGLTASPEFQLIYETAVCTENVIRFDEGTESRKVAR
jgi:hypothetical protein